MRTSLRTCCADPGRGGIWQVCPNCFPLFFSHRLESLGYSEFNAHNLLQPTGNHFPSCFFSFCNTFTAIVTIK